MRTTNLVVGAIVLGSLMAVPARAQDTNEVRRLTILTFTQPVQLPGMTLPAGKYRFEMADINNAAHTVRVSSEDGQKVLGTFHTIPTTQATRDLRDNETLVMFAERPAGQPQAAKEWYYPQRSTGEEFVYPRAQALLIAKANNTSVAAEDNGKVVRVDGSESAAASGAAEQPESQIARNEPAPAPATEPAPVGTAGQAPAAAQPERPSELPRTASNLYLFALLSGLSLAAAFGVRQLRTRAAVRG